jgi:hypothetical protein
MRIGVKKHYKELAEFVRLANLAWGEILSGDEFPRFGELAPLAKHRELLKRIDRLLERSFPSIEPLSDLPPFFLPRWNQWPRSQWRQLHAFALVRRVFDSVLFLTRGTGIAPVGAMSATLLLQLRRENGTTVRVRDPYEDFLAALVGRDLSRVRSCAACGRFFIALRSDQKACNPRCANCFRVGKFRRKQPEYRENRKFRERTGLAALRKGRHRIMALHETLKSDPDGNSSR